MSTDNTSCWSNASTGGMFSLTRETNSVCVVCLSLMEEAIDTCVDALCAWAEPVIRSNKL